jgi:hypothetical protein
MRFMIVIRTKFLVPSEVLLSLANGFVSWWDRYRDRWVAAGFYPGGNGGGGVCEVADEVELHTMIQEWPFTPFSEIDIYPLVDMDLALEQWQAMIAAATQSQNQT